MGMCSFLPAGVRALGPPAGRIPPPPEAVRETSDRADSLGCQPFLTEVAPHHGVLTTLQLIVCIRKICLWPNGAGCASEGRAS